MTYSFDGFNYFIRLDRGESLKESLLKFAKSEPELNGAWISSVGGVLEVELGFYNLETKQYQWRKFDGLREIVSLQGNFALDEANQPIFHLHGVFADDQYQTVGGHVKDLTVGGTCEIFVHRAYEPLHRKPNQNIGLSTLDL